MGYNGLKPILGANKGIGWNRALPQPFGFGKGIGPASGKFIDIPGIAGMAMLATYTIEFWKRPNTANGTNPFFAFIDNLNSWQMTMYENYLGDGGGAGGSVNTGWTTGIATVDGYCVFQKTAANNYSFFRNNALAVSGGLTGTNFPQYIDRFILLGGIAWASGISGIGPGGARIDEFRFYNRVISADERRLNYNNGIGANPSKTEGLLAWYDFEMAELRDTLYGGGAVPSAWQTNTYGFRDKSGMGNHGRAVNHTQDSTLGGSIVAF